MTQELTVNEMQSTYGGAIVVSTWIGYAAIAAGFAAVVKVVFSKRGKVSLGGFGISWGN